MALIDTDIKGVVCEEADAIRVKPKKELWVNNTRLAAGQWAVVPKNFDLAWLCEVKPLKDVPAEPVPEPVAPPPVIELGAGDDKKDEPEEKKDKKDKKSNK